MDEEIWTKRRGPDVDEGQEEENEGSAAGCDGPESGQGGETEVDDQGGGAAAEVHLQAVRRAVVVTRGGGRYQQKFERLVLGCIEAGI